MKKKARKPKRRTPLQDRSRERVARILDAAATEFAEHGVDAATVEGIAERAGTSVGSIYQFYPNKPAIYEAVGDLYLNEVRALFAVLINEEVLDVPWRTLIAGTIDAFAELHRTSVTFRAVWSNIAYSRRFFDAGVAINRELSERAEVVFGRLAKNIPVARRKLMASVVIETMSALLLVAADKPRAEANAILGEAKVVTLRYLETYLD